MPNVLIRDVPKKTLDALKKRAAQRGRSLQQELRLTLDELAREQTFDYVEHARRIRERLLERGGTFTDSTEIIRRDRER